MGRVILWGMSLLVFILTGMKSVYAVPREVHLIFEDRQLTLNFQTQPELLQTAHQHYLIFGDRRIPIDIEGALLSDVETPGAQIETEFQVEVSPENLKTFFEEAALFKRAYNHTVEIHKDEDDIISFEGRPQSGVRVNYGKLVPLLNQALRENQQYVRVPAKKIFSKVVAHPDLTERGITEIIAVGESNFAGSSRARRQNISAAAKKFDGVIIPKGRQFSFNEILEDVTEEDGFVKELVIKGNETEKELGGGVCQVSTTAFRAALNGGFPITGRRNHSYAVPYYKPFGLDATIYLGVVDLRFRNDSPGDILLQTFIEGNDLYYVFYGTRDERRVLLEGPFISDFKEAPDPVVLESEDLPDGEMKVVSEAHDGFATEWVRRIERDGVTEKEVFASYYRPWPAKVLKGTKKEPIVRRPSIRHQGNPGLSVDRLVQEF